jgi:hypothetical protein
MVDLVGGATKLAERAEQVLESGADEELRLAGHIAEMAWLATPADEGVQRVRQRVFAELAANATSTMSRGVFRWAERETLGDVV